MREKQRRHPDASDEVVDLRTLVCSLWDFCNDSKFSSRQPNLAEVVNSCRADMVDNNWDSIANSGPASKTPLGAELIRMVVWQTILFQKKNWKEILQSVAQQLKKKHPGDCSEIDKAVGKHLKKNPVEGFLKRFAYRWLKYLETHQPTDSSWYPHLAVEVAHKVFRLRGKIATFRRYISHTSRSNMLKSIHPVWEFGVGVPRLILPFIFITDWDDRLPLSVLLA